MKTIHVPHFLYIVFVYQDNKYIRGNELASFRVLYLLNRFLVHLGICFKDFDEFYLIFIIQSHYPLKIDI